VFGRPFQISVRNNHPQKIVFTGVEKREPTAHFKHLQYVISKQTKIFPQQLIHGTCCSADLFQCDRHQQENILSVCLQHQLRSASSRIPWLGFRPISAEKREMNNSITQSCETPVQRCDKSGGWRVAHEMPCFYMKFRRTWACPHNVLTKNLQQLPYLSSVASICGVFLHTA